MNRSYRILPKEILAKGVDLSCLGINEYAWSGNNALEVIDALQKRRIKLLGGDVYHKGENGIRVTYDNWYTKKTDELCLKSCYEQAREFIEDYEMRGPGYIYSLVFSNKE